jgi:hypothetical protein
MTADVEIVLDQRGRDWIARHADFVVKADSLAELDEMVRVKLVESGRYRKGTQLSVFMSTDNGMIPEWMRPYQCHYFNRSVSFEV